MTDARAELPEKLAEIAEVIGVDAALKLSAAWPGIRFSVPKSVHSDHPLALAIGLKPARALAQVYGGESIVPPMCARLQRAKLKARIVEEYRDGSSAPELARKYGMHQFSIYRLAAEVEAAKQGGLFEDNA